MSPAPSAPPQTPLRPPTILPLVYLAGMASPYWVNFIWFYLENAHAVTPATNLLLNAGFGFFYLAGCMAVGRAAERLSPRAILLGAYPALIAITLASGLGGEVWHVGAAILAHGFIVAWTWPTLESLETAGLDGEELGRAVSAYNIAWGLTAAASLAASGLLYDRFPSSIWAVPCGVWLIVIAYVWIRINPASGVHPGAHAPGPAEMEAAGPARLEAMRGLSRAANLTAYLLISTLMPLMPFLPSVAEKPKLTAGAKAVIGSAWMASRVIGFFGLGRWHGWHFKMRWLLGAVFSLPVIFAILAFTPSLPVALAAQVALGFILGFIYMSALFYSLHGETTAGEAARHEAIIGLGIMAGPLLSGLSARLGAGQGWSQIASIAFVLIPALALLAGWIAWRARAAALAPRD